MLEHSFHKSVGALDVLALSVVSIARSSDQKFPFVTIPEFGSYAAKVAPLTGALTTSLVPIVRYEQRLEWEEYAAGNNTYLKTYVDASHHLQDAWSQYYGPKSQDYSWTSRDIIYGENGNIPYNTARPNRSDILLPNWHTFPLVANSSPPANWGK